MKRGGSRSPRPCRQFQNAMPVPGAPPRRGRCPRDETEGVGCIRSAGVAAGLPIAPVDGLPPTPPLPAPAPRTAPPRTWAKTFNGGCRRNYQSITPPSTAPTDTSSSVRPGTAATAVAAAPAAVAAAAAGPEAAAERRRPTRVGGESGVWCPRFCRPGAANGWSRPSW